MANTEDVTLEPGAEEPSAIGIKGDSLQLTVYPHEALFMPH